VSADAKNSGYPSGGRAPPQIRWELTTLPQAPCWWGEARCPLPKNLTPFGFNFPPFGPQSIESQAPIENPGHVRPSIFHSRLTYHFHNLSHHPRNTFADYWIVYWSFILPLSFGSSFVHLFSVWIRATDWAGQLELEQLSSLRPVSVSAADNLSTETQSVSVQEPRELK